MIRRKPRRSSPESCLYSPEIVLGYGFSAVVEAQGQGLFRAVDIPVVLLHYDCPFFALNPWIKQELQEHPSYYHHFVWDQAFISPYEKIIGKKVHKILLAADPELFQPHFQSEGCFDLSFVGSLGDVRGLQKERLERYSSQLNESFNAMLERKVNHPDIPLSKIWSEMYVDKLIEKPLDWSDPVSVHLYLKLHQEGSISLRLFAISIIQKVFKSSLFKVYSGRTIYSSELPGIYSNSKINLSFTSFQFEESVNTRLFDVGAARGFLLTDYRMDMEQVFPEWKAISWTSLEECVEKIRYYLAHPKECEELSLLLHEAILSGHTYAHRAQYVWDILRPTL